MDEKSSSAVTPADASRGGGKEFVPSITVAICTRDRPAELERCLAAVKRIDYLRFDVLVVDNAPGAARSEEVAKRWGVRYSVEPKVGLSRARNHAARIAETEIVAYLDDDTAPQPNWLAAVAREFKDTQVMGVAGRIAPFTLETEAERLCAEAGGYDARGEERRVAERGSRYWFEMTNFSGVGIGANMALRRSAFAVWPGFDERLGRGTAMNGAEENHAFFSLVARGYRVIYAPEAVVLHPYPRTMEELRAKHRKSMATAAGYVTLLLMEEPRYWGKTIPYILKRVTGAARPWQAARPARAPRILSTRETWSAWLRGPLLYFRARLEKN